MSENDLENPEKRLDKSRRIWDEAASSFDDEPDHGLRDPLVRKAWIKQLKLWLPKTRASVLDVGCGTGSLSVVMTELGHSLTGIDLSPAMIELAREKADQHGMKIDFQVMDAANPQFSPQQFDVILCRHLLWTLPEPREVLKRWINLLKRPGRLVLIEGFWSTGAGLHVQETLDMLPPDLGLLTVEYLSNDQNLWGRAVTDERYVVVAELK